MARKKRIASVSLDLDNQWSYMKIHGDKGWEEYPSYFDIFIPHILNILDELNLKITFFIVGKDTESEENRKFLKMITEHGHEVGNHSYYHESWLQTYSYEEIQNEIISAEKAIEQSTGKKPLGITINSRTVATNVEMVTSNVMKRCSRTVFNPRP